MQYTDCVSPPSKVERLYDVSTYKTSLEKFVEQRDAVKTEIVRQELYTIWIIRSKKTYFLDLGLLTQDPLCFISQKQNGKHIAASTYCDSKSSTGEEKVEKGPEQLQSSDSTDFTRIECPHCIEENDGCSVVHYSLPEHDTIE